MRPLGTNYTVQYSHYFHILVLYDCRLPDQAGGEAVVPEVQRIWPGDDHVNPSDRGETLRREEEEDMLSSLVGYQHRMNKGKDNIYMSKMKSSSL